MHLCCEQLGRAEKEKSMPFLVQLSSLWFRTTSSHCRACKRSVLQSLPFNSLLSPSGLHKSLTGRASHSEEKKKRGKEKIPSLWAPLKYIVMNHGSSGGHFTEGERGHFPQWLILFRCQNYCCLFTLQEKVRSPCCLNEKYLQYLSCCLVSLRLSSVMVWLKDFWKSIERFWGLLDYSSDQPRNQRLSRGHDKGFLGALPPSPSLSLFWGNCKKKVCAVEWGNPKSFHTQAPACWGCQGLPRCRVLPQCQHQHPTGLLSTSWKRRPGCLWACLTLVTGQTNYSSLPLPSLPLLATACSPAGRGLSKALGVQSPIYQGLAEQTVHYKTQRWEWSGMAQAKNNMRKSSNSLMLLGKDLWCSQRWF